MENSIKEEESALYVPTVNVCTQEEIRNITVIDAEIVTTKL